MNNNTLNNLVQGLFFWSGGIMATTGIITYFEWEFSIYTIIGIGFMLGSFTMKFFSSE